MVGPVVHRAAEFGGAVQAVHLLCPGDVAFQVRPGEPDLGAGHEAAVDVALDLDVGVGLDAAGGAQGGDASRQIEAREAGGHLVEDAAAGRVEEMVVHAHQAGEDGVAAQIDPLRAGRGCRGDLAAHDVDRLVLARRGAGAVDDPDMLERQRGSVVLHVGLERGLDREQKRDEHRRTLAGRYDGAGGKT